MENFSRIKQRIKGMKRWTALTAVALVSIWLPSSVARGMSQAYNVVNSEAH